jgi:hypothetical protein
MKNLKVQESVEAYFEADTEGWRSQILGIVIPQMNNEEVIEFYNELLKRLDSKREKIERSMNIAKNAVNIASEKLNKLKIHNLRAKILLTVSALLFCLCISAQNFKEIDFRGKTKTEISKIFQAKCMISTPTEDIYYSTEFSTVRLFYNNKHVCYKIMIRSGRNIKFDSDIFVEIKKDEDGVTYTIQ